MSNTNRIVGNLSRDLFILEDEANPRSSQVNNVWPSTVLDQVFDNLSPTNKTLREILEDLKQDIITGGRGNIVFPVTSVNGRTGDIIISKNEIGLGRVDNTADIDKPLSAPQRDAINKILDNYDFKINLSDLYDHIMNTDNPHDVTIDQINKDDALVDFVQDYISRHNYSGHNTVHMDIRRSLSQLWILVEDINGNIQDQINTALDALTNHIEDESSHQDIFDKKEDVANKVMSFDKFSNNDHSHYPSTRAVVEYIGQKIVEFNETLPNVKTWIQDIIIIDNRDQLPAPLESRLRMAYFIRNGLGSHDEVAICRPNDDGSYYWDISQLGSYSKFNPNHFIDTPDGLSLNFEGIANSIEIPDPDESKCLCKDLFASVDNKEIGDLVTDAFNEEDELSLETTPAEHSCDNDEYDDVLSEDIHQYVNNVFDGNANAPLATIPYTREPTEDDGECHCLDDYEGISTTEINKVVGEIFDGSQRINLKTYPLPDICNSGYGNNTGVSLPGITSISIITGTMDGHIRYYVNGDRNTMSNDIKVAGLKRLAYMEYVTENEIWDQAIHERHIRDNAIETRHIQDMAVTPDKIKCTNGCIIANTKNKEQPIANEVPLTEFADIIRPLIGGWPDPDTPGGNPYYQKLAMQIPHPQLWKPGKEYDLGDYSYGARFCGTISCVPNMDIKTLLTPNMTTANGHRITDAGGAWVYQSSPLCWTVLGGSNITGHTFATITMDNKGLYLESISTGDRIDAMYDVWVRYVKTGEYADAPTLENGGFVVPRIDIGGADTEGSGVSNCDCAERWNELSDQTIHDILDDIFGNPNVINTIDFSDITPVVGNDLKQRIHVLSINNDDQTDIQLVTSLHWYKYEEFKDFDNPGTEYNGVAQSGITYVAVLDISIPPVSDAPYIFEPDMNNNVITCGNYKYNSSLIQWYDHDFIRVSFVFTIY